MSEFLILDPQTVKPFADQPRKRFRGIPQLTESIRLAGQVTPIVVTRLEPALNGYRYELTDGERRLQACLTAGLKVKAVLTDADQDKFAQSVAANFCRQSHDCLEIAEAIGVLKGRGKTDAEVAGIFGKSAGWVLQHRSLLTLGAEAQEALKPDDEGISVLTYNLALLLVGMDEKLQHRVVQWIRRAKPPVAEARNYIRNLAAKHPDLIKEKRSCKRSPGEQFATLWNAVVHTEQAFARYAEMKHSDLVTVLKSESGIQRRMMLEKLTGIVETFRGLAGDVKKTLQDD
jgi:ParB/RepB/Spo0J family partition protein